MQEKVREKKIVAATSVIAAVFLTGTKLIVGFLTGSLGILAIAEDMEIRLRREFPELGRVVIHTDPAKAP